METCSNPNPNKRELNDLATCEYLQTLCKLQNEKDILKKKYAFLEKMIIENLNSAKENVNTNREVAFWALKRKKRHQKQLQQLEATFSIIEQ